MLIARPYLLTMIYYANYAIYIFKKELSARQLDRCPLYQPNIWGARAGFTVTCVAGTGL
jgi:hypothetical protein